MTWSSNDLLTALIGAGDVGLSREDAERALGVHHEHVPGNPGALDRALVVLREQGHVVADDRGVLVLVHERGAAA